MRLLLAEDEKALSKALTTILERNNYSVDAAYDGKEALEYLEADNYDGVILDIMMPKIDGYKALASIRDAERKLGTPRDKRCKVIMISALDEGFDASYASDDYEEYMCKPIDIMKFDSLIRKLEII